MDAVEPGRDGRIDVASLRRLGGELVGRIAGAPASASAHLRSPSAILGGLGDPRGVRIAGVPTSASARTGDPLNPITHRLYAISREIPGFIQVSEKIS